jgi:putative methanogenesis marker 16 metalloprotein
MKTFAEINRKIAEKTAVVMTAKTLKERIRKGEKITPDDVDVVTCGTFGVMSGTSAVLAFQAGAPGTFRHVISMTLNGVPAFIGPCPNESNGHVDCMVYGTSRAENDTSYGGGHLFSDLAAGNPVTAEIITNTGRITRPVSLDDMSSARLIITRGAFKNYMGFVNRSEEEVSTIFSTFPMKPDMQSASVSGCGEINPLENDPALHYHVPGAWAFVNGSPGLILGCGTRSSQQKPNLSLSADMRGMNPDMMGGFVTALGAECLTSIGTAIPVLDDETLDALRVLDEEIPLPVADVQNRTPFAAATYADIWQNTDRRIRVDASRCVNDCTECVIDLCPVAAIRSNLSIGKACMGCLTCVTVCRHQVFSAKTGTLYTKDAEIPIGLRQSDRVRGDRAAALVRDRISSGAWRF